MSTMQPIEQGSLSARTYISLREALIAGNFRPGERLLMQDLAQRLGTSVTPVREACFRLVSEQALELRSGRFITVPELTRSRYWQVRLIRIALEGLAAELAVEHVSEKDIAKLVEIHRDFVAGETSGDADRARRANREFHFGVYRLSKMDMLIAQIESLWVSMGPILNVYYLQAENDYIGAEEHETLIEALRTRNKKVARKAIERDIVRGGMNLLRYFDEQDAAAKRA
ncbi:GntR family transcriptional regulator [Mesorhizobium sp. M1156]|uniref:GntR family transcriptional regulator n=1 Tax=Mesorhizobium sp. M1156 TaxID=2957064 RepID=UPI00333D2869